MISGACAFGSCSSRQRRFPLNSDVAYNVTHHVVEPILGDFERRTLAVWASSSVSEPVVAYVVCVVPLVTEPHETPTAPARVIVSPAVSGYVSQASGEHVGVIGSVPRDRISEQLCKLNAQIIAVSNTLSQQASEDVPVPSMAEETVADGGLPCQERVMQRVVETIAHVAIPRVAKEILENIELAPQVDVSDLMEEIVESAKIVPQEWISVGEQIVTALGQQVVQTSTSNTSSIAEVNSTVLMTHSSFSSSGPRLFLSSLRSSSLSVRRARAFS